MRRRRRSREWAEAVLDACRAAGVRSAVSVEPGRAIVAGAAVTRVHRRHDQADPRRAHLRRRRRRDERQPAARPVRQRLRGVPARGRSTPTGRAERGSSASTASRATCCCSTPGCRPTSPSAICWPCRSPAPTATRWARTTTRSPDRRSCSSRDGERPAGRAPRDVRRPAGDRRRVTRRTPVLTLTDAPDRRTCSATPSQRRRRCATPSATPAAHAVARSRRRARSTPGVRVEYTPAARRRPRSR